MGAMRIGAVQTANNNFHPVQKAVGSNWVLDEIRRAGGRRTHRDTDRAMYDTPEESDIRRQLSNGHMLRIV